MIFRCLCYEMGMLSVVLAKNKYEQNDYILGFVSATFGLIALEVVFYF